MAAIQKNHFLSLCFPTIEAIIQGSIQHRSCNPVEGVFNCLNNLLISAIRSPGWETNFRSRLARLCDRLKRHRPMSTSAILFVLSIFPAQATRMAQRSTRRYQGVISLCMDASHYGQTMNIRLHLPAIHPPSHRLLGHAGENRTTSRS